jgi:hypothetical protein
VLSNKLIFSLAFPSFFSTETNDFLQVHTAYNQPPFEDVHPDLAFEKRSKMDQERSFCNKKKNMD